ncbi:MAG: hypothetical protein DHS20C05_12540 [Hyphococcus sp.]|nr:MAG: hypothetical protein DHS20C05_12540 [Marinicaulis sp.]
MKNQNYIFGAAILTSLAVVSIGNASKREIVPVVLNGQMFHIPAENVISDVPFWVGIFPKNYDNPDDLLIVFEAEEIQTEIPNYITRLNDYKADSVVNIMALDAKKVEEYRNPNYPLYRDAWKGEGKYDQHQIDVHEASGFYKISNPRYNFYWSALKIKPDPKVDAPTRIDDFWVAHCGENRSSNASGANLTSCHVNGFYENDIYFDFRIIGQNLHLYEQVKKFIRHKLASWEVNDNTKDV